MQRFQFSLDTLLSLRQAKLEKQEQQLAVAVSNYNRQQEKMRFNRENSAHTWANLRGSGSGVLRDSESPDPRKSHSDYLYLDSLEKRSREIDERMHEARLVMENEQKCYADMRKDLRVLEKLRDRQHQKYKQKLEKVQDEASAEMSCVRALLRNRYGLQTMSPAIGTAKEED
ncbi:hypothetical protein P0082_10705 [Candidatus Haliotispira prima]|uniref:Flagellar FliJ protein n=1 Tax=Candidatus Haliotispira prima TaxID=3034016 RepID=A0ABY8MHY2_9SPIO|nr:hypothetical protein P0082_10705 [Candidatus Haliotispira prima]